MTRRVDYIVNAIKRLSVGELPELRRRLEELFGHPIPPFEGSPVGAKPKPPLPGLTGGARNRTGYKI